jgi:hypothetical protein
MKVTALQVAGLFWSVCPEQPQSSRRSTVSAQTEFTHSSHTFFSEGCSCSFFTLQHFLWHTILILLALVFILTGIQRCQFVNIFSFCFYIEIITQLPCGVCKTCCSTSKEVLCHAMAKVVSLTCHYRDWGLIPGQSMWYLWLTK